MAKRVLDEKVETRDPALGDGDLDRVNGGAHSVESHGELLEEAQKREVQHRHVSQSKGAIAESLTEDETPSGVNEQESGNSFSEPEEDPHSEESMTRRLKLGALPASVRQDLHQDLQDLRRASHAGVLMVMPSDIRFETQDVDEQVILVIRQHPVTNIRWILISVLLAIVPFVFVMVDFLPVGTPLRYILVGTLLWELLVLGFVFEEFLRWFFNLYIVTNQRIVDIDFNNLLSREISDADLLKIQDVTVISRGVLASVFNFGDIIIQTAAEHARFEFHSAAQPEKIASVIRELSQQRESTDDGD